MTRDRYQGPRCLPGPDPVDPDGSWNFVRSKLKSFFQGG